MTLFFNLIFLMHSAFAMGEIPPLVLKDILVVSDGKTMNLLSLESPLRCRIGQFNFDLEVERKSGQGGHFIRIYDGLYPQWMWNYAGNQSTFTFRKMNGTVSFVNPSAGTDGPASQLILKNMTFNYFDPLPPCILSLNQQYKNMTTPVLADLGQAFDGYSTTVDIKLKLFKNFTDVSCYEFYIQDSKNNVLQIFETEMAQTYDLSYPIKIYTKRRCMTSTLVAPENKDHDFLLKIQAIGSLR